MASNFLLDGASTFDPFSIEFPINRFNDNPAFFIPPIKYTICLPQKDHYIVERQLNLEQKQYVYNFDHNVKVEGLKDPVPGLPPCFRLVAPTYDLPKHEKLEQTCLMPHGISLLFTDFQSKINNFIVGNKPDYLRSVSEYLKMIVLPDPPKIIARQTTESLNQFEWLNDEEFGRQRVQGLNAGQLVKLNQDKVDKLNISHKLQLEKMRPTFNMILKEKLNFDFESALSNGYLYMVDYEIFDTADYIEAAKKKGRYVCSPLALFYFNTNDEKLYPLCIKILQNDENSPVFTPASYPPASWVFAKLWFQSADGQHMEFITHLYECHLLGEVFAIATHRQLSTSHPIFQLLHPHFNLLLDINLRARRNLLSKDGPIESLLGGGSIAALKLIAKHHKEYLWRENTFIARLKKNDLYNDDKMNKYYYREDGIFIHKNLYKFVYNVLSKFYTSDIEIERDFELHAWIEDISSDWGGTLKGVVEGDKIKKLEEIVQLVSDIIFRVTVEHSIGNHGQWDMYGFTPNVPGALYMDPTKITEGIPTTFEMICNALPPKKETKDQIAITHLLANTDTGLPTFLNTEYIFESDMAVPNFKEITQKYKLEMEKLSKSIEARNNVVYMPYSYMNPSKVCASIYI
ncbi:hypothetical protein DICPUDRAFT_32915 [Dictyostelium purpureum]|uniref:Lipoxygenase domain-containing protein n=1 Tax=Dictyostelium purpureum TaxID=5786 RepID=F0ZJX7_DICPU|nr:uncharacterized protein DICPUDRAFT_32915 [Dictyostelium purpureum]EGC35771.1 hypothetical protein DICPUDRAFT_32915 [Dictyostelium purpureum]|eukprot:XP_003287723.1 hypothetical protein DICPUDRAFT_32915 [Dictyostelium purpureum]